MLISNSMHEVAPITSGGSDEAEIPRQARAGESIKSAEQMSYKWALLWRTIILSSHGKTLYPYCRYVRTLSLEDLRDMLEDPRCRGEANKCISRISLSTEYSNSLCSLGCSLPEIFNAINQNTAGQQMVGERAGLHKS